MSGPRRWGRSATCVSSRPRSRPSSAPAALRRHGRTGTTAPRQALTQAELRVAHAVCRGLSNREVAALLVLSERTVEAHLTNIYRKLEVRSRTELVLRL